jgi:heat shock protein HslJ
MFVSMAMPVGTTGCSTTSSLAGKPDLIDRWVVDDIGRSQLVDNSPATIEFTQGDRAGGNPSCNRFATLIRFARVVGVFSYN